MTHSNLLSLNPARSPAWTRDHVLGCLLFGVGTTEPERMRQGIQKLHASLEEAKIQHVYYESPGTDHEWQTWRRDLQDFAPRLFQAAGQKSMAAAQKK